MRAPEGSKPSIHVIPYGTAEGMATSQMNGGFQPAGAQTAAGDLWFPSVKGAVRISPSRIPVRHAAPVLIERIVADDQPIPLSSQITIPPGHGRLAIDFTLCELVNPQRFSFRYKLEGFDDQLDAGPARTLRLLYESAAGPLSLSRDGQRLRIFERLGSCRGSRPAPLFLPDKLALRPAGPDVWERSYGAGLPSTRARPAPGTRCC